MSKTVKIVLIFGLVLLFLGIAGYFIATNYFNKTNDTSNTNVKKAILPQSLINNKFGFLTGGNNDLKFVKNVKAGWIRPHPGPFLWDQVQKEKDADLNFERTDSLVRQAQESNLAILATIWPFADWDQKNNPNAKNCKVSDKDQFLPRLGIKTDNYLPQYRCNPYAFSQYQTFVQNLVERYDGDGIADMPGLTIPIKYWEVMNEPDLTGSDNLQFYKQTAKEYTTLLIKTNQAIKLADPTAKTLIAGAAGGDESFLKFYKAVFQNDSAQKAFDIGNVHCISNDDFATFNVAPYKQMFDALNIKKPIWVTEAESLVGKNVDENATQTLNSVKAALKLGAEKIFFTQYNFNSDKNKEFSKEIIIEPTLSGVSPEIAYKQITAL